MCFNIGTATNKIHFLIFMFWKINEEGRGLLNCRWNFSMENQVKLHVLGNPCNGDFNFHIFILHVVYFVP